MSVGLAVAVAVASVGFLTGTRGTPQHQGYAGKVESETAKADVRAAPKQVDVALARYAQRFEQHELALRGLAVPPHEVSDDRVVDPAAFDATLAARAAGRAYAGAPPTIPHAVEQHGAPACLACHKDGMQVEGKIARPMSHESYASCTQCHVTRESGLRLAAPLPQSVGDSFVGLASPGHGQRAWATAPPQMPHPSFMRERCASCHGVWAEGLASSHPYRQNCLQCHTPAAEADQLPESMAWGMP
jgi:cytochrome c-type protein NapB